MRVLLCLLFNSFLFATPALSQEDSNGKETQDQSDCVTHTVRNETTGVEHTITRCSSEPVSNSAHKKPEPKEGNGNNSGDINWFWQRLDITNDLDAQTSMADSTFWIMLFSSVGLVISAAGLGYLIRTVNQNAKTFEHIQQSSALELRPYLGLNLISKPTVHLIEGEQSGLQIQFGFDITNSGKTPARDFAAFDTTEITVGFFGVASGVTTSETFCSPEPSAYRLRYIAPRESKRYWCQTIAITKSDEEARDIKATLDNPEPLRGFCSVIGTIRYKDDFTLTQNRHHALEIELIHVPQERHLEVVRISESTVADGEHYSDYYVVKKP